MYDTLSCKKSFRHTKTLDNIPKFSEGMTVYITRHKSRYDSHFHTRRIRLRSQLLLKELNLSKYNVSILLTGDEEIHHFNRDYRHKDKPTNVLSFPFAEAVQKETLPDSSFFELGDIIISLDTAYREACRFNQSPHMRLDWLVTHGLLHLIGFDHEVSEKEADKMYAKEEELLSQSLLHRRHSMPKLAINVDHVATVRQARGGVNPDPVTAASICELAGASGIVVHLREDRRHMQDRDIYLLRKTVKTKLNLEMGANKEIIDIALDVLPDMITLVPEKRQELTTEGGLDVAGQRNKLAKVVKKFSKSSIPVSMFIDPDFDQIHASHDIGASFVEIHTGRYCDAVSEEERDREFELIENAAEEACNLGLIVNGGHGLDYQNTGRIAALDSIDELSIGHSIISRAVFTGLDQAVREMLEIIKNAQMMLY